jgi:excisionase family DNA binding protein
MKKYSPKGSVGYFTTKQVARMYGVTSNCVVKWIERGLIDYIRPGREYFIPESTLDGFEPPKPTGRPRGSTRKAKQDTEFGNTPS